MSIIFAAGGTGGHLYPAIAIADEIAKKTDDIFFLTSSKGLEREILKKYNYKFYEQAISSFVGVGIFNKCKSIIRLIATTYKIFPLIKKGDKVILMGGFVSAPVAIVAKIKGIDTYLHEQNSKMGLVNKIFVKSAKKVFLSFDIKDIKIKNAILTLNPIRDEFYNIKPKSKYEKKILVIGGSQGSRLINNLIISSIDELVKNKYKVTHMSGKNLFNECIINYGERIYKYADNLTVVPYIDEFAKQLALHDIIISRAGSGAISEILAGKRIGIFIPFKKASQNHQYYNAVDVNDKKLGILLDEDSATKINLIESIKYIEENRKLFQANLLDRKRINSAELIASEVLN